ncbi:7-carboxy-7-deazaguanine synthase QueE [Marinicella sp. S1101]|uniref:7-carboxy-7-deazaguanine synthase QueE n=1 Tax=Marinicella marina TaxID=2996016 RepID=UPI002260C6D9|nr:7-carboxy-7-deazaguanine synthase QueE [Marinicella marina]MCX7552426.1 7-carboxy-7-deazaguanine synthase QueE [Marinicella marina]MDJ1139301.1 7-carboxy-7-deazaguanine synthase QueE [Marinicella marina]
MPKRDKQLKIFEIFHSLQGESNFSGLPTVFVRLTGCPLRCTWCDTEYAFFGGEWMHFDDILASIKLHGTPYVCVTGGEPLAQKRVLGLLDLLVGEGFTVSLETAGSIPVAEVNPAVIKVIDMKAPGSGEETKNHYENLSLLNPADQVKFVVADEKDYAWSKSIIDEHQLQQKCQVLLSPVADVLAPKQLAEWILRDQLPVRFQIQLHKHLWGDQPGT